MSESIYQGILPSGAVVSGSKQAILEMHAAIWRAEPTTDCTGQTYRDFAERCDRARQQAEQQLAALVGPASPVREVVREQRFLLSVEKYSVEESVTPIQLQHLKLERFEDFLSGRFRYRLSFLMAGRQGGEIKYPEDWWQAVRERFAPAWWLKRHPVRYRTRTAWEMLPAVRLPHDLRINSFPVWRGVDSGGVAPAGPWTAEQNDVEDWGGGDGCRA